MRVPKPLVELVEGAEFHESGTRIEFEPICIRIPQTDTYTQPIRMIRYGILD